MLDEWTKNEWFSVHQHSKYTVRRAFATPGQIAARAAELGWPAVALTDRGTLAGVAQLYQAAHREGILPIPGMEAHYVHDRNEKNQIRQHVTLLANTTMGWRNLVRINNHMQRHGGVLDYSDIADWSQDEWLMNGVWLGTGCWHYGPIGRSIRQGFPPVALNTLTAFTQAFRGRVFVEVQKHNISNEHHDDDLLNTLLIAHADELGLPVIATSDGHYLNANDKPHHTFMKQIMTTTTHPDDTYELPGDAYHMYTAKKARDLFGEDLFFRSIGGLRAIFDSYDLKIQELDTFTVKVPSITRQDPNEVLRDKVGIDHDHKLGGPRKKRLEQELEVISNAGFAPYMLLVAELCDWLRDNNILYSARGSASGSLVCYRLGITSVDPVKFKLRFDRFLSGDRLKPPDIDLDVDGSRRDQVIEWLGSRFSMLPIGAWSKLGMTDDSHGSLLVKYKAWARAHDKPLDPDPVDVRRLRQLAGYEPLGSTTMHAAGVVVTDDDAVLEHIPIQHIESSDTYVTAFDGHDIDDLGYVKIDVLSVSMLTAVGKALAWSGVTLDEIPWRDDKVFRRIAKGDTHSLFQLGGWSQRQGCMELKPTKFDDLVAAMALFRPAVTSSEDGKRNKKLFLARRRNKDYRPSSHSMHPILADALAETYGVFLYQEQVMQVLRAIGMDADQLTKVLKAIKSSNANTKAAHERMKAVTDEVNRLMAEADIPETQHGMFLQALRGYAEYGFNKSHAVAYARWAFITAWLATHHPQAWWAAELSTCKAEERQATIKAAINDGLLIRPPNVNKSQADWTPEGKNFLRKGLASVPEVGRTTAAAIISHQPYDNLSDLAERVTPRLGGAKQWLQAQDVHAMTGVFKTLAEAKAFEGIDLS